MPTFKMAQVIYDAIYPVGSVYFSKVNVNPSTYFGGTWEMVTGGHYIYATTSSYQVSSYTGLNALSGGSGTSGDCTLTIDQMPIHDHGIKSGSGADAPFTVHQGTSSWNNSYYNLQANSTSNGKTAWITKTGGGKPHNHTIPAHTHNVSHVDFFVFIRTK